MSKGDREPSKLDDIQIAKLGRAGKLHSVQERSIAAAQILDTPALAGPTDPRVPSTRLIAANHDLIRRGSADDRFGRR